MLCTNQSLPHITCYWQRLPIRIELLISVLIAFPQALTMISWRVPTPIKELADHSAQDDFTKQPELLRAHIVDFLEKRQHAQPTLASRISDKQYHLYYASKIRYLNTDRQRCQVFDYQF